VAADEGIAELSGELVDDGLAGLIDLGCLGGLFHRVS
jgi:hypothetical protein